MNDLLPVSHIEEAMKLEAQALVELFQVDLRTPQNTIITLNLCPTKAVTWNNIYWADTTPCSISETSLNVSGEVSRPKFSIVNPQGLWSRYVHQRYVDNAIVRRYRVLKSHLDSNQNIYNENLWRVSKVVSLSKNMAVFELRTVLDGHNFKIPADTYRPPKYPAVSVQ